MIKFLKLFNSKNWRIFKIWQFEKLSNIWGVQIVSKKWKNKFENENIE